MSSSSGINEFRHFDYVCKLKVPTEIKLLSKIYNRDPRRDNVSIIFATADNQLYGYGHNALGCLGLATVQTIIKTPTPIKPLCGKALAKICTGNRFVIVLTEDGKCYSWGDNKFGQLGHGKTVSSINKPLLIECTKNERVVDVVCGQFHVLMLTERNEVYAFGSNVSGAVGNGTNFHQTKPVQLSSISEGHYLVPDIVSIAAGGWHSAAVNRKGELFIWGWNERGQCNAEDTKTNQVVPQRVLIDNFNESFPCTYSIIKSVQCGLHHTLVLTFDGVVFAFGSNEYGECAQDPTTVKMCPQAELVYLEEPMLQICALSKSRLSLAFSQLHFYVWGQSTQVAADQLHIPRKLPISQQIRSHLSFNVILAKNEPSHFNWEVNLLGSNFPASVLIPDLSDSNRSPDTLNFTFNDPLESDTVFQFADSLGDPKVIYVQKIFLDGYSDFLRKFIQTFVSTGEECTAATDDGASLDIKLEQTTLLIGQHKKKFHQLSVTGGVSYEALYAYLFFIYSKYLLIGESHLVEIMTLCQKLDNSQLLDSCLEHIKEHFGVEKLCLLYKCAIQCDLLQVSSFCVEHVHYLLNKTPADRHLLLEPLYYARQKGDLQLTFTDADAKEQSITVHRLILHVNGNLYRSLGDGVEGGERTRLQLLSLNGNPQSMHQLLERDQIHFGSLFCSQTLELYVQFVYGKGRLGDQLTLQVLVNLYKLSQLLGEPQLEAFCVEQLKDRITLENVCQFFSTYATDAENPLMAELCLQVASQDLRALIVSDDFRRLLVSNESSHLNAFLQALSNYCLKQTSDAN